VLVDPFPFGRVELVDSILHLMRRIAGVGVGGSSGMGPSQ